MRRRAVSSDLRVIRWFAVAAATVLVGTALPTIAQAESAADCERVVAALAGRGGSIKTPQAEGLARAVPELPLCGAVLSDSKAPCAALGSEAGNCENRWFVFHDLRANPKGRGFVFPEFQNCASDPNLAKYCKGLREAAMSGDPDKCPKGPVEGTCRALISLDPAMCDKLPKDDNGDGLDRVRGCKERIAEYQPRAKGLKELAESGPEADRPLAKAALGQKDACAAYEKKAMDVCGKGIPPVPPTTAPTVAPTPKITLQPSVATPQTGPTARIPAPPAGQQG